MKFGVVVFPGSNCDQDMIYVLESLLNQEVVSLWHKDTDLLHLAGSMRNKVGVLIPHT